MALEVPERSKNNPGDARFRNAAFAVQLSFPYPEPYPQRSIAE